MGFLGIRLKGIYGYPCKIALPVRVLESSYSADRDQYNAEVHDLNFVFGLAAGNAVIISLVRLKPEYYGKKENEYLFSRLNRPEMLP